MTTYISAEVVEYYFKNPSQIVFEVTENCNMACSYCTFGDLYNHNDNRGANGLKRMTKENVDIVLGYYFDIWDNTNSSVKDIYISFYGGEPLMNISLIKYIVNKIEVASTESEHKFYNRNFIYSLTTNGLLLGKHIEFFVENNFSLLISLDGDKEGNSYRVLKASGESSFEIVMRTINEIKEQYPDYFEQSVSFNSVLHNKNSLNGLIDFFSEHVGKRPTFNTINPAMLSASHKEAFKTMNIDVNQLIIDRIQMGDSFLDDYFYTIPIIKSAIVEIFNNSGNVFKSFNNLLFPPKTNKKEMPTGTCIPFSKKIFISARGLVLPCERISHQYAQGIVKEEEIKIDFQAISDKFNECYNDIENQCKTCAQRRNCLKCVLSDNSFLQKRCESYKKYSGDFVGDNNNTFLTLLLKRPDIYQKIITETTYY